MPPKFFNEPEVHLPKLEVLDLLVSSEAPHQRMVVLKERTMCGIEQMILQQETFSPDVGWFIQSRVAINREQLCGLKLLLTGKAASMATSKKPSGRNAGCEEQVDSDYVLSFTRAS